MKKIIWLASYPKSGNTWVRAFLTTLLKERTEGFLDRLVAPMASNRLFIEDYLYLESSEYTAGELLDLRPPSYRAFAGELEEVPFFIKAHDAYIRTNKNEFLFPADVSLGAVYIVRNPLDVAVSFAHHNGATIDATITSLANPMNMLGKAEGVIRPQLEQPMLTWSEHVASWTTQAEMPVEIIRYEDLKADTFGTFKRIVQFSNMRTMDEEIRAAIELSSFHKLQSQEQSEGFREKPFKSKSFFRKGIVGSWREELSDQQVKRLISDHHEMMTRFGYIDDVGNAV
jgi:hypothetical protein